MAAPKVTAAPEVTAILKAANAITEGITGNTEALGQVVRPRGPGAEVPRILVRPKKGHQRVIEAILFTTIKQVTPTSIKKANALNILV